MLTLTRRVGESIIIGDDVVITVVDIRGDKVKLGVAAPIEARASRSEAARHVDTPEGPAS